MNTNSEERDGLNTLNEASPLFLPMLFVTLAPRRVMDENIGGSKLAELAVKQTVL